MLLERKKLSLRNASLKVLETSSEGKKMKQLKFHDSFIVNALRNCGYNNYSAIADIIDNSLEPEVESTYVKVDFETEGTGAADTTIKSILVIDDGNDMTADVLEEAMTLGSETGKNGVENLGMYGAGMKTASFSIGQKMEVFSKVADGEVNYAVISLENEIKNHEGIFVDYAIYGVGSEEYKMFKDITGSDHGTIVKISALDKLSNKNYQNFKGTLKNKIGENFNKFIYANVVKFYVRKDEVPYVDLMGNSIENDLMGEGTFNVEGHTISYKAWYMPRTGGVDSSEESNEHIKSTEGTEYMARTFNNQGLYIYRQNRLVGKALTLGIWARDPWKNGFRCEVFMDGTCDSLFGSTFTKMISEKSKDAISQSLYDKLTAEVGQYATEAGKRDKKDTQSRKENDPVAKKATEDFYKRVTEKQNKNMMLKANRKGENKPKEDDNKEHNTRGKQKNPNPVRTRTNKWLDGFDERPMGRTTEMYGMERSNGKRIIVINTDHPFYQRFYSKLDNDLKFTMAQIISCEEIAKQNINYYGAEEIQQIIDNYNAFQSNEVSKSLCF